MRSRLPIVLLAATLLWSGPALPAEEVIRIKGSDTIGGKAMPDIAETYAKKNSGVRINIDALGSSTAFVGLFDGSADIGASSRTITEKELAQAKELGLRLTEIVIGFDGVAVIVHKDNPVKSLSVVELSNLFTGKVSNWKDLGGKDSPIRLISRPSYSGTHVFFKEKALRRGNAKGPEEFAQQTELLEDNADIVREVSKDPRAVSYVGLGWVSPSLRAVPIAEKTGSAPVPAAFESVRSGKYPLYRPLLVYVAGTPRPASADFIRYVLSAEGAAIMTRNGFIPPDSSSSLPAVLASVPPRAPAAVPAPAIAAAAPPAPSSAASAPATAAVAPAPAAVAPPAKTREVVRVPFGFGSTTIGPSAARLLDDVSKKLSEGGWNASISGHADARGKPEVNERVALARAHAVANALLKRGVPPKTLRVEAAGAEAPVASNESDEGRAKNRRVDVELIPAR
ncbi:MAG TPA: phosphate ABC transporter substrate-binding/OmpA family protein [Thermoanaerobaculia bacterium]|nr:phosphate ABC transporter substrate-binding/OmpA family protein [Thermoanaerobaculia bacterium]